MSQLYSFKGQDPKEIPDRIRLSDGTTKTDKETFTAEDLTDAGFTGPYTPPTFDEDTEYLEWNTVNLEYDKKNKYPTGQTMTDDQLWVALRTERTQRLIFSDWAVLEDSPLSDTKKSEYKTYRQQLRDLPSTVSDIRAFNFFTDFPSIS
jgi:hypothetical protein